MKNLVNINGVEGYLDENGVPQLKLEHVARGLGFTQLKNGIEYVRWERVDNHLTSFGVFPISGERAEFIPEPIFYLLCMKAENEIAQAFQRKVAFEVLPAIRKHGAYMTQETLKAAILNPDTLIQLCQQLKAEQSKNKELQIQNSALTVDKKIMRPKAEYFDELVDRNLLTNFRETAKQLNVAPKAFVSFLLEHKYVYRDKKGKLQPYQQYKDDGLFNLKECVNEKTGWGGTQTLVTPKGRETFRLMFAAAKPQ